MIIHDVEQNTPEWRELHLGIPTASMLPNMVTPKTLKISTQCEGIARKLAAEVFSGIADLDSWGGNATTDRGHALEARALSIYEFAQDDPVHPVGFITDVDHTWGASPDAIVGEDGLAEVKCFLSDKHIEVLMHHHETGLVLPELKMQTQGQMLVAGRKWCDSIFYHPDLPLLIVRNLPDESLQSKLKEAIAATTARRDEIVGVLRLAEAR